MENFKSWVAHKLNYKDETIVQQLIALRRANPDWGKLRIAQEMVKDNHWEAVVSPNTVRRILQGAQLWPEDARPGKKIIKSQLEWLNNPVKPSISTCVSFRSGIWPKKNCLRSVDHQGIW